MKISYFAFKILKALWNTLNTLRKSLRRNLYQLRVLRLYSVYSMLNK